MGFKIMMFLAASAMICGDAPQTDNGTTGDNLQGVWHLNSGEADGNAFSKAELKDGKLEIKGDHYTVFLAEIGKVEGTQTLGAKDGVLTIDTTNEIVGKSGETCLGIYDVNGDEFRVILAPAGADRPTNFETAPNSGQWMHVWKRAK